MNWRNNPELYDELISREFLRRQVSAPGECIVNFGGKFYVTFDWLTEKFGSAFALDVITEAEYGHWESVYDNQCGRSISV